MPCRGLSVSTLCRECGKFRRLSLRLLRYHLNDSGVGFSAGSPPMKHFLICAILLTTVPAVASNAAHPQKETAGFVVMGKVLLGTEGQPIKKAIVKLMGQNGDQRGQY